jgi:SMI1/KNR4 family protein SUKH-1
MDEDGAILDAVIRAWRSTAHLHHFADPIDEDGLLAAEARLGRQLPHDLVRLYQVADGLDGFDGNLRIVPALTAGDWADELRKDDWPIASELLVFGDDGAGEHYALWYPEDARSNAPTPVVEIGEIFEGGNLALVGTTFPRFLRTWTAFRLVEAGEVRVATALGVTASVRASKGQFAPYIKLSDPTLPHVEPDPYVQRLKASRVADLVAGLDRRGAAEA